MKVVGIDAHNTVAVVAEELVSFVIGAKSRNLWNLGRVGLAAKTISFEAFNASKAS